MTEKRWLYFALGVTTVISVGAVTNQLVPLAPTPLPTTIETDGTIQVDGFVYSGQGVGTLGQVEAAGGFKFPDGTVQMTAAPRDPRRGFYLTPTRYQGGPGEKASPIDACDAGYHFASIWEILDVSSLRYDSSRGYVRPDVEDAGQGPPSAWPGWVRTGFWGSSQQTDYGAKGDAGIPNCDAWTTNLAGADGTIARLNECWEEAADCNIPASREQALAPWWLADDAACNGNLAVWCVEDYPGAAT